MLTLKFTIGKLYCDEIHEKLLLYRLYKLVETKEIRNKTFMSCNVSSHFITSTNVNFPFKIEAFLLVKPKNCNRKRKEYHSCWDKAFDPQAMYVNIEGV